MCGIIGAFAGKTVDVRQECLRAGLLFMERRGPDGEGFWREQEVALGHRRLATLDLEPRAAQPMHSACGRYVITYNGEIYNFRELRLDLEKQGTRFRTTSDTEVILALFASQGESILPRLYGMFAFVVWDRKEKRAFVARDPYGIKPLYYSETTQGVVLASQVKALLATGLVSRDPDPRGQAGFWLLGSVPEPHTWYREIRALPAGHCAWIEEGKMGTIRRWADIGDAWRSAERCPLSEAGVKERVRNAVTESVARHVVSDVPVGVFLSGGIDSGTLAGLMVEAGVGQLEGVTLSYKEFEGSKEDEAPAAAQVAEHYGIRHHVRQVTREEFQRDLPRILETMDQPSIDGVNTWFVSKGAAEIGLKVVLSGVGGDELFQGYSTFRQLPRVLRARKAMRLVPGAIGLAQRAGRWQAGRTGNNRWSFAVDWTASVAGAWLLSRSLYSPQDLPELMGPDVAAEALQSFSAEEWVTNMSGPLPSDTRLALAHLEATTYLRNQLLRDSDWASMDHGIELRTPLVDAHLLGELQPVLSAFAGFSNKTLLSESPRRPLPAEITGRTKTGFRIPIADWIGIREPASLGTASRVWARTVARHYSASEA